MNEKKLIGIVLSLLMMCSLLPAFRALPADASAQSENPFNKQDDAEVPYDRSRWIQPVDWNTPTVDPRDYEGGVMLFFDKIGLEPEYAPGKIQRVYFSCIGAEEPVNNVKFHFFYDTRLTVVKNTKGNVITPGKALADFTTGSAMIEEGQIAFYAVSNEAKSVKGCIFTIDFLVPEDAEAGELYPFGLAYVDDGIVCDTFLNSPKNEAGILQMTYVFTKGIYNGYIKIIGEKKKPEPLKGDVNGDGEVGADDAQLTLIEYVNTIAGFAGSFTDVQKQAGDFNGDQQISIEDAQEILLYYVNHTLLLLTPNEALSASL